MGFKKIRGLGLEEISGCLGCLRCVFLPLAPSKGGQAPRLAFVGANESTQPMRT